jgi:hypothetical protein
MATAAPATCCPLEDVTKQGLFDAVLCRVSCRRLDNHQGDGFERIFPVQCGTRRCQIGPSLTISGIDTRHGAGEDPALISAIHHKYFLGRALSPTARSSVTSKRRNFGGSLVSPRTHRPRCQDFG